MKTLLAMLALTSALGCTSSQKASHEKELRRQGHVTVVAGGADFIVTTPVYRRYQALSCCFPRSVWDYVQSQPAHRDGSSLNKKGTAAWVDVSGHFENIYSNEVFVATQVHQISPAHTRFIAWRRQFGSGNRVPDYAE
ncbi:hypothetical protein [Prosthecobacter sp.]|uniref:hypothetical protein n=1 Tax=Prosthecobacter sp. TaxID=1965333 RepID=UPI002489C63E|nr:hypothetical protein [Prosthecobacter sp.]MDI1310609.1 hypothetical protein [Prosthecobacter sp.]